VQFDPRRIPGAPLTERDRRRFWCMKCGGRGADVTIAWTIPPVHSTICRRLHKAQASGSSTLQK
jgi:hypothetical protein